jgi:hypothetical protein
VLSDVPSPLSVRPARPLLVVPWVFLLSSWLRLASTLSRLLRTSLPFRFCTSLPTLSMPRIAHGRVVRSASEDFGDDMNLNDEEEGENLCNCQFSLAFEILLNIGTSF